MSGPYPTAVAFPDVEAVLVGVIRDGLAARGYDDVVVTVDLRGYRAGDSWVRISRIGGDAPIGYRLDQAVVDVWVLAATRAAAFDLAQDVRLAARGAEAADLRAAGIVVASVDDAVMPTYVADPDTNANRFISTVNVRFRPYP